MIRLDMAQSVKLASILGSLLLVMACAKPPAQEMSEAENAVNTAMQAGAEQFASEELNMASEALADAKAKLESKDYKGAKMSALDAKSKAEAATATVEPNKQAAKAKAEERAGTLKPQIAATNADAMKVKGKDAEAIKGQVAAITQMWPAIEADMTAGNYVAALGKMDDTEARLGELKNAVALAAAKPSTKKK